MNRRDKQKGNSFSLSLFVVPKILEKLFEDFRNERLLSEYRRRSPSGIKCQWIFWNMPVEDFVVWMLENWSFSQIDALTVIVLE